MPFHYVTTQLRIRNTDQVLRCFEHVEQQIRTATSGFNCNGCFIKRCSVPKNLANVMRISCNFSRHRKSLKLRSLWITACLIFSKKSSKQGINLQPSGGGGGARIQFFQQLSNTFLRDCSCLLEIKLSSKLFLALSVLEISTSTITLTVPWESL